MNYIEIIICFIIAAALLIFTTGCKWERTTELENTSELTAPAVVSVLFSAAAVVSVVLLPQPVRSDAAIAAVKHNAIAFFIICSSSNPIRICNFFDETHYTTGLYKKQAFMHVFLHIYAVPLIL